MTNNRIISAYYLTGLILMISQVIFTVFQASQVVHYGQHVAQLERRRQELELQYQRLEEQLSDAQSLQAISDSGLTNSYSLVTSTLAITDINAVAAR